MLDKIGAKEPDDLLIARKALTWLMCCTRPLKLNELVVAIAISPNDKQFNQDEMLDSNEQLLDICGSLIKMNQDSLVELGHFSVREYLKLEQLPSGSSNPYFVDIRHGHQVALDSCLSYLSFTLYKDGLDGEPIATEQQLLHYAVYQWPLHGLFVLDEKGDTTLLLSFLNHPRSHSFYAWGEIYEKPEYGPQESNWAPRTSPRYELLPGYFSPIQQKVPPYDPLRFALHSILRKSFVNISDLGTTSLAPECGERIRNQLRAYGWEGWSPCSSERFPRIPGQPVCEEYYPLLQGGFQLG